MVNGTRHAERSALIIVREIGSERARDESDAGALALRTGLKSRHVPQGDVCGFSRVQAIRRWCAGILGVAQRREGNSGQKGK